MKAQVEKSLDLLEPWLSDLLERLGRVELTYGRRLNDGRGEILLFCALSAEGHLLNLQTLRARRLDTDADSILIRVVGSALIRLKGLKDWVDADPHL